MLHRLDSASTFSSLQLELRHFAVRHFGLRQKIVAPLKRTFETCVSVSGRQKVAFFIVTLPQHVTGCCRRLIVA
jgi:hypothetical protein